MEYLKPLVIYLIAISLIAIVITVKDKRAAKAQKWRVPEDALMFIGLLGGSAAMYITMRKIKHKTRHKKLMIGLPIEIVIDLLIIFYIILQYIL